MTVHLTRQRFPSECPVSRSRVEMVCLGLAAIGWVGSTLAFAQGRVTDVLVSVVNDKVIAVTGVGQSEIDLSVGETVVSTKAQGLTALAITSTRLLGFSSQLRHWGEQTLEADEHVITSQVLREFCVVATDQHLYGFQETLAHWTGEALGGSERVQERACPWPRGSGCDDGTDGGVLGVDERVSRDARFKETNGCRASSTPAMPFLSRRAAGR